MQLSRKPGYRLVLPEGQDINKEALELKKWILDLRNTHINHQNNEAK